MRRATEHLETALAVAPDAMLVVDASGLIVLANEAACGLFGYTTSELCGLEVENLVPGHLRRLHLRDRGHFTNRPQRRMM